MNISRATYSNIVKEAGGGSLSCVAYLKNGNYAQVSQYMKPGYSIGLYSSAGGGSIVATDSQSGPLDYECGVTNVSFGNGTTRQGGLHERDKHRGPDRQRRQEQQHSGLLDSPAGPLLQGGRQLHSPQGLRHTQRDRAVLRADEGRQQPGTGCPVRATTRST